MKNSILSKLAVLFVFSIVLQSCTADSLPGDPAASVTKTVVKPADVSADVIADVIADDSREPSIPIMR
jgi:hypothetical protein